MLTHAVSLGFGVPSAHSPMMTSTEIMNLDVGIVDPRKAPEAVSSTYFHCILKGLHKSPRIVTGDEMSANNTITARNVSCIVMPYGCVGLPTLAALEQGIPIIAVKDSGCRMKNRLEDLGFQRNKLYVVDNYLEAVGVISALKASISVDAIRRPIEFTKIEYIGGGDTADSVEESPVIAKDKF